MALDIDEVRHVARLARLALSDDETEALRGQLSEILAYAQQIGEVATEDVAPTAHAYSLRNVWRADESRPSLPREEAIAPAPEPEDGRFAVPRIVDET